MGLCCRSGSSIITDKGYSMRYGHEHERYYHRPSGARIAVLGPVVVGILSALVAVAPYLLAVLLILGVIAFFCK